MNEPVRYEVSTYGDRAVMVVCGRDISMETFWCVQQVRHLLATDDWLCKNISSWVPGYTTLLGKLVDRTATAQSVVERVLECLRTARFPSRAQRLSSARVHDIPVCYGGEFGPDLPDVARIERCHSWI